MAEHVFQWRNMMEFFLIKHFRRCLPLLLKYDVVGESRQSHNVTSAAPVRSSVAQKSPPKGSRASFTRLLHLNVLTVKAFDTAYRCVCLYCLGI